MGYRYKRRLVHYTEDEGTTLPLNVDTYVPVYTDFYSRRTQSLSLLWEYQLRGCNITIYKLSQRRHFSDANFPTLDAKLESVFWNSSLTKQAVSSFVTNNHLAFCRISTRYGNWPVPRRCIYVPIVFGIDFLDWITRGTSEEMACES